MILTRGIHHTLRFSMSKCLIRNFSLAIRVKDKIMSQLDPSFTNPNNMPGLSSKSRAKLKKGLEEEPKELHPIDAGILDSIGVDVAMYLNDHLDSSKCSNLFKGMKNASDVITIEGVTMNRDCSHATAAWSSDIFQKFIKDVYRKFGEDEGKRMEAKIYAKISKTLQDRESQFRTALMKSINFRRVPRIFFVAPGSTKALRKDKRREELDKWIDEYQRKELQREKVREKEEEREKEKEKESDMGEM